MLNIISYFFSFYSSAVGYVTLHTNRLATYASSEIFSNTNTIRNKNRIISYFRSCPPTYWDFFNDFSITSHPKEKSRMEERQEAEMSGTVTDGTDVTGTM